MSSPAESDPRTWRRRLVGDAIPIVIPSAALLIGRALGPGDAAATWRAALVGMVLAGAVGAFAAPTLRSAGVRVFGLALLAAAVHLLLGAPGAHAWALALLYLGVAAAAAGLAALGRRVRAPELPAGAVAALVVWVAMAGLYWADPVAEHLPRTERHVFRQAALHVDPSLALAYDAAGFDRLRAPEVYASVPLASSLFARPRAGTTAVVWLALGLLAGGAGRWGRGARRGAQAPGGGT